jgi:hypothetical protein
MRGSTVDSSHLTNRNHPAKDVMNSEQSHHNSALAGRVSAHPKHQKAVPETSTPRKNATARRGNVGILGILGIL